MTPIDYLGLIPARRGSMGIPRKNMQTLGGKPLLQWTIEAALGSRCLGRTLVTSDDRAAIALARDLSCEAPFVRPEELARDDSPTIDVVLHALDWLEKEEDVVPEHVVLLQPTSPFRTSADIDNAIDAFRASRRETLFTVVPVSQHPAECVRLDGNDVVPALPWPAGATRRQALPAYYYDNGAVHVARTTFLRRNHTFRNDRASVYIMEPSHSIDIDEPYDLDIARGLVAMGAAGGLDH